MPTATETHKETQNKTPEETPPVQTHWEEAERLLAVKVINGKRHYRVKWANPTFPNEWIQENDVSDYLKQCYHITHTQAGKSRKRKRNNRQ
jgi:hypothetical protein